MGGILAQRETLLPHSFRIPGKLFSVCVRARARFPFNVLASHLPISHPAFSEMLNDSGQGGKC